MGLPATIMITATIDQLTKDYVVKAAGAVAPNELAIVINTADYTEQTTTIVGVLLQCHAQMLSALAENSALAFYQVNALLPDGQDKTIVDLDLVPVDRVGIVAGSLFGQDAVYGVELGANLAEQSHNIDRVFNDLLDVLQESEITTPEALANPAPTFEIVKAAGVPGDPALLRVSGTPWITGLAVSVSATTVPDGVQAFNVVLEKGYTTTELANALAGFAGDWDNVMVYVKSSTNPNIRDVFFEPHLDGVSLTLDTATVS